MFITTAQSFNFVPYKEVKILRDEDNMHSKNTSFSKTIPKMQFFLVSFFFVNDWILMGIIRQCTHPHPPPPTQNIFPPTPTDPKTF